MSTPLDWYQFSGSYVRLVFFPEISFPPFWAPVAGAEKVAQKRTQATEIIESRKLVSGWERSSGGRTGHTLGGISTNSATAPRDPGGGVSRDQPGVAVAARAASARPR